MVHVYEDSFNSLAKRVANGYYKHVCTPKSKASWQTCMHTKE